MERLGARIGRSARPGTVIALRGGLGAGKTTLTRGIASGLGVTERVTSPTFAIVSEYSGRLKLIHVDAYRLSSGDELDGLGGREFLGSDALCVVEWSEHVESAFGPQVETVEITPLADGSRRISVSGEWLEGLLS